MNNSWSKQPDLKIDFCSDVKKIVEKILEFSKTIYLKAPKLNKISPKNLTSKIFSKHAGKYTPVVYHLISSLLLFLKLLRDGWSNIFTLKSTSQ